MTKNIRHIFAVRWQEIHPNNVNSFEITKFCYHDGTTDDILNEWAGIYKANANVPYYYHKIDDNNIYLSWTQDLYDKRWWMGFLQS